MNDKSINKLRVAANNGSLIATLNHAIVKRWPLWWIKDESILDLQIQGRAYRKLKRKYQHIIGEAPTKRDNYSGQEFPRIIWWCWLQGYEHAPELVKSCYASLKKNMPGYEIRILTNQNIQEYIEMPQYILEKFENGMISAAHYSDILRLKVLIKYGGIWIDSTVLCTGNEMCETIEKSELYVYQELSNRYIAASNWFIAAQPHNKILELTEQLLLEFWKNNKVVSHYYIFHLFFSMATKKYANDWKKVRVFDNVAPHIMVKELNEDYSEDRMRELSKIASFHKLNYKLEYGNQGNTFYQMLIKQRRF